MPKTDSLCSKLRLLLMVLGKNSWMFRQSLKFSPDFSNFGEHLLLFIQVAFLKQYFLLFCNKDYRTFFFFCTEWSVGSVHQPGTEHRPKAVKAHSSNH